GGGQSARGQEDVEDGGGGAGEEGAHDPGAHVGAEGVDVAVGEIHDPHHAVDQAEAAGGEEERGGVEESVEDVDDEDVHQSLTRNGITFTSGFTRLSSRARVSITR